MVGFMAVMIGWLDRGGLRIPGNGIATTSFDYPGTSFRLSFGHRFFPSGDLDLMSDDTQEPVPKKCSKKKLARRDVQ